MLSLSLAAVLTWAVTFPSGQVIPVTLASAGPPDLFTQARPSTLFNPLQTAAVVSACTVGPADADGCDFFLVTPERGAVALGHRSGLPNVFWTPDSQYVIVWGESWVRMWNLRGVVRGVTPEPGGMPGIIVGRHITKVWVQDQRLCVQADLAVSDAVTRAPKVANPSTLSNTLSPKVKTVHIVSAYSWPMLSKAKSANCLL